MVQYPLSKGASTCQCRIVIAGNKGVTTLAKEPVVKCNNRERFSPKLKKIRDFLIDTSNTIFLSKAINNLLLVLNPQMADLLFPIVLDL
jgi:hypothetical protein